MNLENLEFLVYDLAQTNHDIWTGPHNIFGIFQVNYPEVTLDMVKGACECLFEKNLLDRYDVPQEGTFYRRSRVWKALNLPKEIDTGTWEKMTMSEKIQILIDSNEKGSTRAHALILAAHR